MNQRWQRPDRGVRPDRAQRPGRPPRWWPDNEAWPPMGGPPWARGGGGWGHRPGRRFMRRMALGIAGYLFTMAVLVALAIFLVSNVVGPDASAVLRYSSLAVLVVLFLGLGGGGRMVRRFTRPVGELIDAASQIEAGDLSVRVREHGPREVRSVARAFNEMAEQLEATDARRRTFLADVTHELRTPLSVIRGRAEGIVDGVYPGDREHVEPMLDAARTLEGLIEDLRTLALADAGGLTLHREPVDVAVLVNETLASFATPARDGGVTLSAELEPGLPVISADPGRLQSVVSNLVANALRHTPSGGSVRVAAARAADSVMVVISDTGEGIAPDLLPHIFERFVKGSSSSGSGLGLAIARDLVVAHGGQIRAESTLGVGTTITFTLPAA